MTKPGGIIELPWTPRELWPNARPHYQAKARVTKKARLWAYNATLAVLPPCFKHNGTRIPFVITAYPPTKAKRDDDNMIASCKAYRDGIATAMGIDDNLFDVRFQCGEPVKGGKIVVTLA